MSLSLYDISVPPMLQGFEGLERILHLAEDYCKEHKCDAKALLSSRLHADMFGLIFQVQMCCNTAKLLVKRIAGKDSEVFDDKEQTFEELYTRMNKSKELLKSLSSDSMDGDESRKIDVSTPLTSFTLGARDYVQLYAMPNFYFHKTTAYCILRSQGVSLSKVDFMAVGMGIENKKM